MLPNRLDLFANHVGRLRAAALRLEEERPLPTGSECFSTDSIVLLALSAEIGLKALCCQERNVDKPGDVRRLLPKKSRGHDLLELFLLLADDTRSMIEDRVWDLLPTESEYVVAINSEESTYPDGSFEAPSTTSFVEWLETVRHAFEAWRYHYEGSQIGPVNVSMLHSFSEAIEQLLRLRSRG